MQHALPRWLLFSATSRVGYRVPDIPPSTQPADKSPLTPPQGVPISVSRCSKNTLMRAYQEIG